MPRSGDGSYRRTDGVRSGPNIFDQQRLAGVNVNAGLMDAHANDMAAAITGSLPRDGQAAPTADIPFGGHKITNLGNGANAQDAVSLGQASAMAAPFVPAAGVGGTANAITLTPATPITSYSAGQRFRFVAEHDNTGAVTVAVSGLSAISVVNQKGEALDAGDIKDGQHVVIAYTGTYFQTDFGGAGAEAAAPTDPFVGASPALWGESHWSGEVRLHFALPATDAAVTARTIQHKAASQTWAQATEVAAAASPVAVTGLDNDVARQFRVKGTIAAGDSGWSNVVSVTPRARPHVVTAAGATVFNWPWPETRALVVVQGGGGGGGGASSGDTRGSAGGASTVTVGAVVVTARGGDGGLASDTNSSRDRTSHGNGGDGVSYSPAGEANDGAAGQDGETVYRTLTGLAAGTQIAIVVGGGGAAGPNNLGDVAGVAPSAGGAGFVTISPL